MATEKNARDVIVRDHVAGGVETDDREWETMIHEAGQSGQIRFE